MKLQDAKCPICGAINHKLCLEETDGWMECVYCNRSVQPLKHMMFNQGPLYNTKLRAEKFAAER